MKVVVAQPRGFCAGVARAINIVESALETYGPPVYVRHEIVHNRQVVDRLRSRGAVFVEELREVPVESRVIFSAHGVAESVRQDAGARQLHVIDATCPLVSKVHEEVHSARKAGHEVIVIGHVGHPEVTGTLGQSRDGIHLVGSVRDINSLRVTDPDRISYVTQTTLSMDECGGLIDALRRRFPRIHGPRQDDICYATQNRQNAVKALAKIVDLLIVLGSAHSSNSNRLREVGEQQGVRSVLVESPLDIDTAWLSGVGKIGLTAGASTPEAVVAETVAFLMRHGATEIDDLSTVEERVEFRMPKELIAERRHM